MEGKNPQAVMLNETRQLKGKWEQTGLLEGLNDKEQGAMSVLLENQAKQLLDEACLMRRVLLERRLIVKSGVV